MPETTPVVVASLRTIDFSKLMDRDSLEMNKLILACQEVGFFFLNLNSPGCQSLLSNLDNVSQHMKEWFEQDKVAKMKTVTVSNSHGYKPVGHHAGVGKNRDGWEALKLGRSELRGRWALPSVVRENLSHFSDFQDACHFVTKLLLDCISSKLELRGNYSLQQYHRDDAPSKSSLFFNHYPTLDTAKEEVGQNQHTDLGSLTLLFAPQWGLQVLSPVDFLCLETGEQMQWQSVEPRAGHAIVNVGDTLRFLSNYRLRSALHRALPLESCDRYSIAYFLRPSDDSEFQDSMGKTTTAVNWYLQKNETYESHEKQDELILLGGIKELIHKAPICVDV
ncbi:hypothetical protein BKA67DRAFT_525544 [Truncatella angustata]|uniref:Fe2OG dioxygenase domain-containing protein n=1 Tax=Truncatella angustata TaxID=152316 RepID=A0A9P8RNL8_9PEZI|nr:uncharacterized protein BKA67DRAFT_525544 [Truncatella angustata]KAH6646770.1 hypothetical protein BKA67DRAFT_525544 [Truncatella angustata]